MWIGCRAEAGGCCFVNGVHCPTKVSASQSLWVARSDAQKRDSTRHDLPVVQSHSQKPHACDVLEREKMWRVLLLLYNQQPSSYVICHFALVALSIPAVQFA